jgi:hypothetical protein
LREEVARGVIAFQRELRMERGYEEGEQARRSPGRRRFKQRKEEGCGRKEKVPTGGATMSATTEKEKGKAGRWAAAGGESCADGPAGLKGKGVRSFSFLFLFPL